MAPAGESPAPVPHHTAGTRAHTEKGHAAPPRLIRTGGAARPTLRGFQRAKPFRLEPEPAETAEQRADRRFAEDLGRAIAKRHGRVGLAIFTDNVDKQTTAARRELAQMLRALGWSLPRIGAALGRDHSSVHYLLVGRKRVRR